MRSAFSNLVNDDVRDSGLVVLSTFTSPRALEWVLHSDRLLFTTACLIRATYTTIKKKVIKSGE
jgi:hypothetical protein